LSEEDEASLSRYIKDAFKDSHQPATKREVAILLAGVVAAMEAIQSSHLALSYDPRSEEGKSNTQRFEKSMEDLFASVRESIKMLGEDNGEQ